MNPSVLAGRPGELPLDVYQRCPRHQFGQRQVSPPAIIRNYVLSVSDVLEDIFTLRFLPDVGTRGGSPEHIYADASQRVFGIQIEVTSLSTKRETVQYELFIGQRLAYASRAAERKVPMEKLPTALRGVGTCQLRYGICCGALFVFEVRWGHSRLLCTGEHC